jgi:hypothetical protein
MDEELGEEENIVDDLLFAGIVQRVLLTDVQHG